MKDKITNAELFQKLEDNQQYLKTNLQELKTELTCLRDEFNRKHEERVTNCATYRAAIVKEMAELDKKTDGIKIVSITVSAIIGFVGGVIGALIGVFEYLKRI